MDKEWSCQITNITPEEYKRDMASLGETVKLVDFTEGGDTEIMASGNGKSAFFTKDISVCKDMMSGMRERNDLHNGAVRQVLGLREAEKYGDQWYAWMTGEGACQITNTGPTLFRMYMEALGYKVELGRIMINGRPVAVVMCTTNDVFFSKEDGLCNLIMSDTQLASDRYDRHARQVLGVLS